MRLLIYFIFNDAFRHGIGSTLPCDTFSFPSEVGLQIIEAENDQTQTGGHGCHLDPGRHNALGIGLVLSLIYEALIHVAHAFKEVFSAHT